jgi:hypothetical protein
LAAAEADKIAQEKAAAAKGGSGESEREREDSEDASSCPTFSGGFFIYQDSQTIITLQSSECIPYFDSNLLFFRRDF